MLRPASRVGAGGVGKARRRGETSARVISQGKRKIPARRRAPDVDYPGISSLSNLRGRTSAFPGVIQRVMSTETAVSAACSLRSSVGTLPVGTQGQHHISRGCHRVRSFGRSPPGRRRRRLRDSAGTRLKPETAHVRRVCALLAFPRIRETFPLNDSAATRPYILDEGTTVLVLACARAECDPTSQPVF